MRVAVALVVGLGILAASRPAAADTTHIMRVRTDERGSATHVVPRWNDRVRMAAERVVLVPWFDARTYQPRLLVHVWYDLVNEGPAARLELGFPELDALVESRLTNTVAMVHNHERLDQRWNLPTISAFVARVGTRDLPVSTCPGVGRYRQWYTFGLDLPAGRPVRLHNVYLSSVGSHATSLDRDEDNPRYHTSYFLHYVLHTGARWRGPIGKGEILLYSRGRLRRLRGFENLEPTLKDDLHVPLDLSADLEHEGPKEELEPGVFGHRNLPGTRLDRRRLLSASSTLESERIDTHVGLVVDGDPETRWVSAKGKGVGAEVDLPSDPEKDLAEVRVGSGTPGPVAARPSRLKLTCLKGWRKTELATPDLPDQPGPHVVPVSKPQRCDAVRVEVTALHGDRGAAVAVAELELRFAGDDPARDAPHRNGTIGPPTDPLKPAEGGPGSARYPLPPASDPRAFEVAGIDRVSWSGDGTLLHYQLHLEDRRQRPRGVRLGYFVDVATGKPIRAYRIDREGDLPEPYRTDWDQALTPEDGRAILARHGFVDAVAARAAPRASTLKAQRLELVGSAKDEPGALVVVPARAGFTWRYVSRPARAEGRAEAALELRHEARDRPGTLLARRAPAIDRAFAIRHAAAWQALKPIFAAAVKEYVEAHERSGASTDVKEEDAARWHLSTYRYPQAYYGEARVFWHPTGEALAVLWVDQQDHLALTKPPETGDVMPECAEIPGVKVCPWERRDDLRQAVAVTVHAITPRAPTTLLSPYVPPPPPVAAATPAPTPRAAGRADAGRRASPRNRSGGCGCAASGSGAGWPLILLCLVPGLALRRRAQPRGSSGYSRPETPRNPPGA
jgi:hypothetical protein